ncbi:uncharacterized protein LOC133176875 isoform X2 [Saccostrea echinata]|uniref:uncharacterized protein LOC133176875 isoform X2 n=1 Tax=Saccostrea echinata TaxID=191078 RepID=UPI002A816B5F|nr:uncharacterized protein LOC133176875 isoform X2 [Saccostrea echinata]
MEASAKTGKTTTSKIRNRIGTDCGVTSTINENSKTQIEFDGRYDGKKILSGDSKYQQCDRIIFQTKNYEDPDAKYRICISPIYFNDRVCAASLDYKNDLFASPLQSFDCHKNLNSRFCVPTHDKLYVFLKLDEVKSLSTTTFLFRVTAERVDETKKVVIGAAVGGAIGGLAVLGLVCVIVVLCRRSKKRKHESGGTEIAFI